jgi:hypothetical protein
MREDTYSIIVLSFHACFYSINWWFEKQHSSPRERKWGSASLLAHRNAQVEGALRKRGSTGKNLRSQSFEFLRRESKEKTDERSGEGNELSLSLSCNALYPMRGEPLHSHAMSYFTLEVYRGSNAQQADIHMYIHRKYNMSTLHSCSGHARADTQELECARKRMRNKGGKKRCSIPRSMRKTS